MENLITINFTVVLEIVTNASNFSDKSLFDREKFKDNCLPKPFQDWVEVDAFHAQNLNISPGKHLVWFVTRADPQSVFFDEQTGYFGVCWGPNKSTGTYDDLGFRSKDPLDMFFK